MANQDSQSEPFRGDPPSTEDLLENLERSHAKIDECYQTTLANFKKKSAELEKELAEAHKTCHELTKKLEAFKIAEEKGQAANNPTKQ
ncbi:hypothetical protein MCOR25_011092 [Pyricularia grisea]|uniref:Uncharacterized protein n=1 Tax=Pyricularia grisea TaxID=148305 RepID=A0A6P8ARZ2_PYRGI|nr:uncharacterized protein PgNI_09208 [Pyricularia grisea]KAI6344310.1 hypothetical protein MCOR25_011092 [Pyricularia grisea]TLD04878.1 hypothetical protein PgNI_09208 [Pyricularia grisea]